MQMIIKCSLFLKELTGGEITISSDRLFILIFLLNFRDQSGLWNVYRW